jgi:hypothetical protein
MDDEAAPDGHGNALALDGTFDPDARALAEVTEGGSSILGASEERGGATARGHEDGGPAGGRLAARDVQTGGWRRSTAARGREQGQRHERATEGLTRDPAESKHPAGLSRVPSITKEPREGCEIERRR